MTQVSRTAPVLLVPLLCLTACAGAGPTGRPPAPARPANGAAASRTICLSLTARAGRLTGTFTGAAKPTTEMSVDDRSGGQVSKNLDGGTVTVPLTSADYNATFQVRTDGQIAGDISLTLGEEDRAVRICAYGDGTNVTSESGSAVFGGVAQPVLLGVSSQYPTQVPLDGSGNARLAFPAQRPAVEGDAAQLMVRADGGDAVAANIYFDAFATGA